MARWNIVCAYAALTLGASGLHAQLTTPLDSAALAAFRWRSIGPTNMGGRVTDVEGLPSPSKTFYIAPATGGIWKTTNNGTTFRQIWTNERIVSMGDLAIAPSDSNQIWAGTGEEDSRNSISPGGGIFKSTDGGTTWVDADTVLAGPSVPEGSSVKISLPTASETSRPAPSAA